MVLQRTDHEADVPFVEQNGIHTQADAAFTDADGREVDGEVKSKKLAIATKRLCACEPSHINCLTAKEWIKCQLGVWQFTYEGRDIRDKTKHPATFPISLARRCIELFSHEAHIPQFTERKNRIDSRQNQADGEFSDGEVEGPKPACVLVIPHECAGDQCLQSIEKSSAW